MYKPIRDYGIIGNLRSAALVGLDGSIDWTPAPFLGSSSVFASILDENKGGSWKMSVVEPYTCAQEYIEETNTLITRFTTEQGILEVVDCLPMKKGKAARISSEEEEILEIQRKAVCVKGKCKLLITFAPRIDYARGETNLSLVDGGVVVAHANAKAILISIADFKIKDSTATALVSLKEGEDDYCTFRYNTTEIPSKHNEYYEEEVQETKKYWQDWVHRCDLKACLIKYPWHEDVLRSSLVLKILFFEPVGSIAAAATTSLPEEIGGVRNWDYRFTWIRDSAFTIQALFWIGYLQEADAYVKWLMSECQNVEKEGPEHLQIMYGLRGQRELTEEILPHLEGYEKSSPVRIGNGAYDQRQWDVYGDLINTVWQSHLRGSHVVDSELWQVLRSIANYVVKIWQLPDEGLWEVRGGARHFVHSKVMCWIALDRAIRLAEAHGLKGEIDIWKEEKEKIYKEVMEKGWSEKKQSFVQSFGSEDLDASLLRLPVLGFIDGKDPKMISTIQRIEKELSVGDGLLMRYKSKDGLTGKEGAFLLTSFWLVDALVFSGERERAKKLFEKLLGLSNHLGLFSEEIDPKTNAFLGNFPQAYTHIGLINSAFHLSFDDAVLQNLAKTGGMRLVNNKLVV